MERVNTDLGSNLTLLFCTGIAAICPELSAERGHDIAVLNGKHSKRWQQGADLLRCHGHQKEAHGERGRTEDKVSGTVWNETLTAKDGDLRLSAPNAWLPKTEISVFISFIAEIDVVAPYRWLGYFKFINFRSIYCKVAHRNIK